MLKVLLIVVALVVLSVGIIHAADDDPAIPLFTDGRVNNAQIDAPVGVYCVFDRHDDDTATFQRIEVWGLNSEKLLEASAAQIAAADNGSVLDTEWSYTLTKLTSKRFNVTAPNGYSFTWERGDLGC